MQRSAIARARATTVDISAPVATQPLDQVSAQPLDENDARYFRGPAEFKDCVFDFETISPEFLSSISEFGELKPSLGERKLLPEGFKWRTGDGKPRIPAALCEFTAYKAALAYADEKVIEANLGSAADFKFFDTRGKVADTQGYAFQHDGMAFIVMRGSEKQDADWAVNFNDRITDNLHEENARQIARLKKRHGADVDKLLTAVKSFPGTHLGFAIAWVAVRDQIADYLRRFDKGMPIVLAGHSLGGALAMVGAFDLNRMERNVVAVTTFGAPLVGNTVFADAYAAPLGSRGSLNDMTVRFEAAGDSVPRIMRRWYYKLNKSLQSVVLSFANAAPVSASSLKFKEVGNALMFVAQPPLSESEVRNAIQSIIDARERAVREAAEQAKKDKAEKEKPQKPSAPSAGASSGASTSTPASGSPSPAPGKPSSGQGSADIVVYIFVGTTVLIVLLLLYLFARHKLQSHAITERYALFLSTLSYQQIRAMRLQSADPVAQRLELANADLDRYLKFIRGNVKPTATYFSKSAIGNLPVRLKPGIDLATFLSQEKNIV